MKIYEKAPAKINLMLDVLHKRPDGYHEVEMIMTMVDLADRLEMSALPRDTIIISSQAGYIPLDEKNLAFQAAKLIKERYNVRSGVYIHLDKKIPVAAGLAGGSSDAAATLRGLNRLWELGIPEEELKELGAELGSDVPFCVTGGTALATGRGEVLTPLANPPQCWVVLAKPPINVSTAEVYGRLQAEQITDHPSAIRMREALERRSFTEVCQALGNVLEQVTLELHPEVAQLKEAMLRLGADGVLMSGSGPTVFGLVSKESKVSRIYNGLRGFCKEVYAVRLLT
ncbi:MULTISPECIES: 4-(cytidine 5'-diphospho)-2-C-methyl-D-erythritol kinase [Paenibacillus]|jgi:4-diphosphocytidyl-2-C-methyl-D-erythritol kinase|uniref:4-diphosphocytidyl-2-C-methyl-D-erythritol kinase n=1 Tax=Paenibacillus barengoltzii J12 TaxID=935846 RepID=A0ABY1M0F5_9BACL|nr:MULTISPECIES: 4-(cytidine 5'-diphospho)-2-C-methyl-D-erythritol kinase [Paenibacillus]MDU0330778.1 4-(cytidine 5'-diphospho)-2-C-methyl-D-erythritol kinase [Paenibacillus sp. 3LSP]MEC2345407.1 4-(cytidine 5'-diphospho)-2-C-methyl-D-erythritol kinase [Paenibacillus barengoltzii]SMF47041.1 4-diphosphocytidyl-2-C-methyl-D-erythritol kinase [Paenibacillus barengoltzii J12]SMF56769.1 4-diphosphocytidyl-2-C-methyl-D-erythritol kinase [Paenibacillus barengoltzii]